MTSSRGFKIIGSPAGSMGDAIWELTQALEGLTNTCCRGEAFSTFEVIGPDGRFTGERLRLCNGCHKEQPLPPGS